MKRRHFLISAAGVVGAAGAAMAQAPAAGQAPAGGRAGAAGRAGGGGRGGPAPVPQAKLDRIAMMTLNHNAIMHTPWAANPSPAQPMAVLELPQCYADPDRLHDVD